MLPARYRLPKEQISDLLRHGLKIIGESVVVRYKKTTSNPGFAFVVPAKIDKRATTRNRIRRLLSESVRHLLPPVDGVVIVRKNIASLSQKEVQLMLEKMFHEIFRS
jgi:ribonuclease P protein component